MKRCESCGKTFVESKDVFCPHCGAVATKKRVCECDEAMDVSRFRRDGGYYNTAQAQAHSDHGYDAHDNNSRYAATTQSRASSGYKATTRKAAQPKKKKGIFAIVVSVLAIIFGLIQPGFIDSILDTSDTDYSYGDEYDYASSDNFSFEYGEYYGELDGREIEIYVQKTDSENVDYLMIFDFNDCDASVQKTLDGILGGEAPEVLFSLIDASDDTYAMSLEFESYADGVLTLCVFGNFHFDKVHRLEEFYITQCGIDYDEAVVAFPFESLIFYSDGSADYTEYIYDTEFFMESRAETKKVNGASVVQWGD